MKKNKVCAYHTYLYHTYLFLCKGSMFDRAIEAATVCRGQHTTAWGKRIPRAVCSLRGMRELPS